MYSLAAAAAAPAVGPVTDALSMSQSHEPLPPRASRLGLALFWIYVAFYGGFMGLVLARPDLLALRPFGGVNLAIAAGMGLIAAAFILAVVYMFARAGR